MSDFRCVDVLLPTLISIFIGCQRRMDHTTISNIESAPAAEEDGEASGSKQAMSAEQVRLFSSSLACYSSLGIE